MDNKNPIITQKINLCSIQKLNFSTKDGEKIEGVKLYYLTSPSENQKDNYLGGILETSFISGQEALKIFEDNKHRSFPTLAILSLKIYSTTKPPRATSVKIG